MHALQMDTVVSEEVLHWEFDRVEGQRRLIGQGATAKVLISTYMSTTFCRILRTYQTSHFARMIGV